MRRDFALGHGGFVRDAEHLDLPPPFELIKLREVGDAFAAACAQARERGAGALFLVGRFDLAELALVLEPEEPLVLARRTAFYTGMLALTDALSALAPPEKPIAIIWPDGIAVDGAVVGGGQLAWPQGAGEGAVPDWLVFGATIRTVSMSDREPGLRPLVTALEEEGFRDADPERLAAGFARHFMVQADRWRERGFAPLARDYANWLDRRPGRFSIDENGDLLIREDDGRQSRKAFLPAIETPSWREAASGG